MRGDDFIGRGWRFPIRVNAQGRIDWSEGPARLQDAIWITLATGRGERVMRPGFGAGINDFVLQSNSAVTRARLADDIRSVLARWEPRIDVERVSVDPVPDEPSQVLATIAYRVRATNELFNIVHPLYLEEGAL
ncbi:MAG: GPW/gp25 family protein [Gemmatimonadota bacterium]|jgi:phage baseplate assembly protein W